VMKNMAKVATPTIEVAVDGDDYSIKTITTLKTSELKFKLNQAFDEARMDGKTVTTTITRDGNKLIQKQGGEKPCEIVREFAGDKLTTVCTCGKVTSTRIYTKQA